jgi:hypothetical protein
MTTLDDFFRRPADSLPHPLLCNWKARLDRPGASATLEVFRPEGEIGQSQPEINLQFTEDGKQLPLETVLWDDDLNAGLIQLQVRAANPEEEAERFALGLRAAMRKAWREFGDGYFNAVLIEFLKDSDLLRYPEVAEVLKHAYAITPSREGKGFDKYNFCREMIADAISGRARELTGPLKYPQEDAKRILLHALAKYLDGRFSVSSRQRLGLL